MRLHIMGISGTPEQRCQGERSSRTASARPSPHGTARSPGGKRGISTPQPRLPNAGTEKRSPNLAHTKVELLQRHARLPQGSKFLRVGASVRGAPMSTCAEVSPWLLASARVLRRSGYGHFPPISSGHVDPDFGTEHSDVSASYMLVKLFAIS